jgi:chemotaxis methyl-accepting protein methylase
MILQEVSQAQSWDCETIATDIDENSAEVVAARYGRGRSRVPDECREKYLIDGDEWGAARTGLSSFI